MMGATAASSPDVIVVGAGFAGMYMIHKLRKLGMSVQCLEAGDDVGGTWYWNRYPGCRCDVPSFEYSYSFSDDLQQDWDWPDKYAVQPEILRYAQHVADRFDLRRDIRFGARVAAAEFDRATNRWTVETAQGDTFSAPFLVMATGCLSLPRMPDFPGRDSFRGELYHTGLWPHEGVDFTGKRVGVIGTGSSGVQSIPLIAAQAAHTTVFQRTPNFSIAAFNHPHDDAARREVKARYGDLRAQQRRSSSGIAATPTPDRSALEDTAEERTRRYEDAWQNGHPGIVRTYNDIVINEEANDTLAEFIRDKIRATVKDPAVAALLAPTDHAVATKRICLDTGYFETFNRPNVKLVDVRSQPIVAITPTGIETEAGHFELDAIVFATGFDAVTGAVLGIDPRVAGEERLADVWAHGPRTYLGLGTAGFPNLFFITGPGSPSVLTNMIVSIEQHVEWIVDCLDHMRANGLTRIEADAAAQDAWVEHVNEVADTTLFPRTKSWYTGSNIPGKPRVFLPYIGGHETYRTKCDAVAANGYEGFVLSGAATAVAQPPQVAEVRRRA